jgi:ATP/ADP translocase
MGTLTTALLVTGQALRNGSRWAWNTSWGVGALVMLFGGWVIVEPVYAKVHRADDYFGIIVGPLLMLCALIGFALLTLPQTRRHFTESAS